MNPQYKNRFLVYKTLQNGVSVILIWGFLLFYYLICFPLTLLCAKRNRRYSVCTQVAGLWSMVLQPVWMFQYAQCQYVGAAQRKALHSDDPVGLIQTWKYTCANLIIDLYRSKEWCTISKPCVCSSFDVMDNNIS